MVTSSSQRSKLLYLMKILHDKTDKENPITINEIIAELNSYGISAERKSIYTDFRILRQFGLDIEMIKSKSTGYCLASRKFEIDDLKLLVYAVQSANFIAEEKSEELITKLYSLVSEEQAKIIGEIRYYDYYNADIDNG